MGALLRREGLYSSHLTDWRRERRSGERSGRDPRKRGRTPRHDAQSLRIAELERENLRLNTRLEQAEISIEVKKSFQAAGTALGQDRQEALNSSARPLDPIIGITLALKALGVSRPAFYRRIHPAMPQPPDHVGRPGRP